MFLMFPEKESKVMVSVTASAGRGLCRSQIGGMFSP